jgi:hypothetical protein
MRYCRLDRSRNARPRPLVRNGFVLPNPKKLHEIKPGEVAEWLNAKVAKHCRNLQDPNELGNTLYRDCLFDFVSVFLNAKFPCPTTETSYYTTDDYTVCYMILTRRNNGMDAATS